MNAPALELVRCGCGQVRNDEDKPAPLALALEWFTREEDARKWEFPRVCRRCGALYMLPRQTAPSSDAGAEAP